MSDPEPAPGETRETNRIRWLAIEILEVSSAWEESSRLLGNIRASDLVWLASRVLEMTDPPKAVREPG